jgi:hypothetical protein
MSTISASTTTTTAYKVTADTTGTLVLQTGATPTTAVTIDTSQNVGIGTSSPSAIGKVLNLYGGAAVGSSVALQADNGAQFCTIYQGSTAADPTAIFSNNGFKFATATAKDATGFSEKMRIDSSGNLLVGTTSGTTSTFYRTDNSLPSLLMRNGSASGTIFGATVNFSAQAPNNTTSFFLQCNDTGAERATIRSNGGLANYSANNVNLSDERTKTDIIDAGSYLEKICAIPVRTFKYKDQTDDLLNLGVIAQEVETVAPELVDVSGFGDTPEDGVPLKAIYQTDLQYALMKCIQELKAELDAVKAQLENK